jgi:hypothetical protein
MEESNVDEGRTTDARSLTSKALVAGGTGEVMIEISNVEKWYGDFQALTGCGIDTGYRRGGHDVLYWVIADCAEDLSCPSWRSGKFWAISVRPSTERRRSNAVVCRANRTTSSAHPQTQAGSGLVREEWSR